ncbi:MAG TPA: MerR family transcriptional regulator [Alphaproteobacteria bacterium]
MKSAGAFRTISEVATDLDVPQHVLRFWETKFSQIRPLKRGGGRRYYRPEDVELLRSIRALLYGDGYTIKGVQKLLREGGLKPGRAAAEAPAPTPRIVEAPKPQPVAVASAAPSAGASATGMLPGLEPPGSGPSLMKTVKAVSASGLDEETKAALKTLLGELAGLRALLRK